MIKVAFIARSTLYAAPGGDTIQVIQTAKWLEKSGMEVSIYPSTAVIRYEDYDILHFFNLVRPSDILYHISRSRKPFVLSPNLVDYSEYDQAHRPGITGLVLRLFSPSINEYLKVVARWLLGNDALRSKKYLWKGHRSSICEVLKRSASLLPNSMAEYQRLTKDYKLEKKHAIIPNGVDPTLFKADPEFVKNDHLVVCMARVEGIKNQLNLIRALNDTKYTLLIVGNAAPNQRAYYERCRKIASQNIVFQDHLPQQNLVDYYKKAKVHVLPSWFETCGLSSLEAAAMGCNIVVTERGYTRDYFGDQAFYCDPNDPDSILKAVDEASKSGANENLQNKILEHFTWQQAATLTLDAYQNILSA